MASAVALLPLLGWEVATGGWPQAGPSAWVSVLVLALLTSIVGYVLWYWALAHGGISRIAGIQFTQPLFGLLLAAIVLAERPGPVVLVAAVAILSGAWLVQRAAATGARRLGPAADEVADTTAPDASAVAVVQHELD